jgi:prepilin-type N-terminal cleavage/methylation domain-containing protein
VPRARSQAPRSRWHARRRPGAPRRSGDAGMTLVEVLVALLVLSLVVLPATKALTSSLGATNVQRLRVEATGIATTALEEVQHEAEFTPPVGGTTSTTQSVGGETFSVATTFTPVDEAGGSYTTVCQSSSGGSQLQIWLVSASVSWTNMHGASPVVQTTEVAPGTIGASDLADGEIAVAVDGLNGDPLTSAAINYRVAPVLVAGSGSLPPTVTGNTGDTGCGVALGLDASPDFQWVVTLTPNPGYVATSEASDQSPAGPPATLSPLTVEPGEVTQLQQPFQVAAGDTATVTFETVGFSSTSPDPLTPDPAVLPASDIPVTVASSGIVPNGQFTFGNASTPVTSMLLYPFASGYSLWSGDAPDSDPSYVPAGENPPTPLYANGAASTLSVSPGGAQSLVVPVYPLSVSAPAGSTPSATEVGGAGYSYALNAPPAAGGDSSTGLPLGQYAVSAGGSATPVYVWITPSGCYESSSEMNTPSDGTAVAPGSAVAL